MCTLIVSFQQHQSAPLIVAANRDESKARPASPAHQWPGERFFAPRDDHAGGTWVGLTDAGMFVGVTNRFPSERDSTRQSRGRLVVEALRAPNAVALHGQLSALSATRFNPFHLLYADRDHAFVTWSDGAVVRHEQLEPGLHVVTERSLGGDDHGRTQWILNAWPNLPRADGVPTPEGLWALLQTRNPDDAVGGVYVDLPELNYGTRSSVVLFVGQATRWIDS